jgi:signal transduction histidine kinase
VIVAFLVWVLLAWVRDRNYLNGLFVLRQSLLLLYTASFLGYHRVLLSPWLEPAQLNAVYSWLVILAGAVSLYFEYRFLCEYQIPRWGHAIYRAVALMSVGAMGLYVMGYPMYGLRLNTLFIAVGLTYIAVMAWCIKVRYTPQDEARQAPDVVVYKLPKYVIVIYNTFLLVVLALSVLPGLGILTGSVISIYGVLLYGLISCILMSCLLFVRSRERERIQQEVINHLFLSRQQLAFEQQRRQDQSQLISMLMHELKTPLSIIDMAVSTRGSDGRTTDFVHRAVSSINGILDRCIQTDRMAEGEFKLQHHAVHLSDQLTQWLADRKEGAERIAAHITPGLTLTTDAQCVHIIVNNLIENALRHGHPSESVQVSLTSQAGLLLRVSNLPGSSGQPDSDQLFSKYYRSTAAQSKSGTGLGLYLSHKLAHKLGGTLRYRSDDLHITFELWLPISASS